MTEEIKEKCKNCKYHFIEEISFDYPQSCCNKTNPCHTTEEWLKCDDFEYSKDYITNLQQLTNLQQQIEEYQKALDETMSEKMNLQQENEFLKLNNPEMNIEHFRVVKENKVKIDRLRKENEKLKEQLQNKGIVKTCENCEWFGICPHSYREYDYKQRIDKAIEYVEHHKFNKYGDIDCAEAEEIIEILQGENND